MEVVPPSSEGSKGISVLGRAVVAFNDSESQEAISRILADCGLAPVQCSTVSGVESVLGQESILLILCEASLADGGFSEILRAASCAKSHAPVVVCSGIDDKALYMSALDQGAFDLIAPPYRHDEVMWIVETVLRRLGARSD